jgi:predicted porin
MKKQFLALALLPCLAGAAYAQSNVTVYGSFDGGLRNQTNVDAAGNNRLSISSNGTYNSNRLGFRGTEDLGAGAKAFFNLELGFNSGTGALDAPSTLFNRQAYVGIGNRWGQVSVGRQNTVAFKTWGVYEPLGYKFPVITGMTGLHGLGRFNNNVQYTGVFDKFTVRAEYSLGEQVGNSKDGSSKAAGVVYSNGPVSAGTAYTRQRNLVSGVYADASDWTLGGALAFAPFKVFLGYSNKVQETGRATSDTGLKDIWTGISFDAAPAVKLTAAYYRTRYSAATGNTDGRKNLAIIGAIYELSKRTNFYADIDRFQYSGTAVGTISPAGKTSQNGVSAGLNHLF